MCLLERLQQKLSNYLLDLLMLEFRRTTMTLVSNLII